MYLKDYSPVISLYPSQYQFNLISASDFSKENFLYLLHAQEHLVKAPFNVECRAFPSYAMIHTLDGSAKVTYLGEDFVLEKDNFLFIDCRKPFKVEFANTPTWNCRVFLVNGSNIKAYYNMYHQGNYVLCVLPSINHIPAITSKLIELGNTPSMKNELLTTKYLTDLLTELLLCKEAILKPQLPHYIAQIKEDFDKNFSNHFSLDTLSATYNISKSKLIKDFKTYLSSTPYDYLQQRRLDESKRLLEDTDHTVYKISSMVGIDNCDHFRKLFTKYTGFTPSEFRKASKVKLSETE